METIHGNKETITKVSTYDFGNECIIYVNNKLTNKVVQNV